MTKSAYNRLVHTGATQPCVSILGSRDAFSPFYTRRPTGCIDRPNTIARASFPRAFSPTGPSPLSPLLPTAPRNPLLFWTISTAAFDVPLARPTHVLSCMPVCVRGYARARAFPPPVMRYIFYFICVFFSPCMRTSYHAPLTTGMSIIRRFRRNRLPLAHRRVSLYPRLHRRIALQFALQLA